MFCFITFGFSSPVFLWRLFIFSCLYLMLNWMICRHQPRKLRQKGLPLLWEIYYVFSMSLGLLFMPQVLLITFFSNKENWVVVEIKVWKHMILLLAPRSTIGNASITYYDASFWTLIAVSNPCNIGNLVCCSNDRF